MLFFWSSKFNTILKYSKEVVFLIFFSKFGICFHSAKNKKVSATNESFSFWYDWIRGNKNIFSGLSYMYFTKK